MRLCVGLGRALQGSQYVTHGVHVHSTYLCSFLVPTLLETGALTGFVLVAWDPEAIRYGARAPNTGILGTLAYATIALILNLPAVVLTYR